MAHAHDHRVLLLAAAVSLAMHAVLVAWLPELDELRKRIRWPSILTARLVESPPEPAQPKPAAPEPRAESVPSTPPRKKSAPAPRPSVAAPKPAPAPAQERAIEPAPPPIAESAPVQSAPIVAAPAAPAVPAQGPAQAAPRDDAGTLRQYRLALMDAARRYKQYPRVARDNNWEGRAEVRLVIGANGAIAGLSVRSSSGHQVLDAQALDMIRRAKPEAPIPEALRGREFSLDLPVVFSLREAG